KGANIYTTSPAPPPDIILASSPSPFVVAAGEKLAKKFRVPCVAEIRDLWPESIFAYFPQKRNKWYAKFLQNYERKIYERADAIIMTWAGGADYIVDQGWESTVDLKKVHHVAHGVDIEEFDQLVKERPFFDPDLADKTHFKAVYTGSVRFVNNLGMCVDAARILRDRGNDHIRILVWGQGTELDALRDRVKELELTNIVFKGLADRKNIPSILTQSDCALLHNTSTVLNKYGQSQNKFYEYLAAAKPILMTYCVGRSVIRKEGCGIELDQQTPESIANALEKLEKLPREEYDAMAANARRVGESLDTKFQMEKRIKIIEDL
ncbi:MAG: glycosyltransferase family 4 protein, partial [Thermoguttaceae bacterium]|nr:glycosyltransferase family 4 protein [Thermoguttaceae bacterium]